MSGRWRAFVAQPVERAPARPFWRKLGFTNLVLARIAKANKRRLRVLEEWTREGWSGLRSRLWMSRPVSSGRTEDSVLDTASSLVRPATKEDHREDKRDVQRAF